MKKILLLPIDERPCSCLFPQMPARALNEDMGAQPRVYVRSNRCAAPNVQPLYEDRYIGGSVKYMAPAAGGLPAFALADADMVPPVYADEPMKNQNGHIAAEACWFPWERTFGLGVDVRSEGKAVIRERM